MTGFAFPWQTKVFSVVKLGSTACPTVVRADEGIAFDTRLSVSS
jgi:hypothetical protein